MRMIISEIISESEVALLPDSGKLLDHRDTNKVVKKILEEIGKHINFTLKPESYCSIEERPIGHLWHPDVGTHMHMPWCTYGGSIVLNDNFEGGNLKYRSASGVITEVKDRRPLDLYLHSSDEWHMIEPSTGIRRAFLIFI
jgi:hypothetical protein